MSLNGTDLLLALLVPLATMLAFRVAPLFVLRGRQLSPRVVDALGLIPAAAFSALVANDLLDPAAFALSPLKACVGLASASVVAVVASRTGSLVWCAVVGMLAFALFGLLA